MANSSNIRVRGFNQHLRKLLTSDVPDDFYYGKASNENTAGTKNETIFNILRNQNLKTSLTLKEWDGRINNWDIKQNIRPKNHEGNNLEKKVFGQLVNPIHNAYGEMIKNISLDYRTCYDHYVQGDAQDSLSKYKNSDFQFYEKNRSNSEDPNKVKDNIRSWTMDVQNGRGPNDTGSQNMNGHSTGRDGGF